MTSRSTSCPSRSASEAAALRRWLTSRAVMRRPTPPSIGTGANAPSHQVSCPRMTCRWTGTLDPLPSPRPLVELSREPPCLGEEREDVGADHLLGEETRRPQPGLVGAEHRAVRRHQAEAVAGALEERGEELAGRA